MKHPLQCLAIIFLLAGCRQSGLWINRAEVSKINYSTDGSWVEVPENTINNPEMLCTGGNLIVWSESSGDFPVRIYDMISSNVISCIRKGRADNEILNVNQLAMSGADRFSVSDIFKKRMTEYLVKNDTCFQVRTVPIQEYSTVCAVGDTLIGVLPKGDARYCIKTLSGEILREFGDYSSFGMNNEVGRSLMQGHLQVNRSLGRMAQFCYYTGAYEIIDYRKDSVVYAKMLDESSFDDNGQRIASMRPDSKINFISVTSSDNYIYALYDGNMIQYYIEHKGEVPSGKYICVFDWDGNYVKCYQSRFPIRSLSWNPDDKNLYACVLADDGEYRIYMFNSFR